MKERKRREKGNQSVYHIGRRRREEKGEGGTNKQAPRLERETAAAAAAREGESAVLVRL